MPPDGVSLTPNAQLLSSDEIIKIAQIFVAEGVKKVNFYNFISPVFNIFFTKSQIRLTGGEPLVRRDVVDIVTRLKAIPGMETLAITTNGLTLSRKLPDLKAAGLDAINIRFDSRNSDLHRQ